MKTKVEVIKEVKNHFENNPRSVGSYTCFYNGPNGEHCAFAIFVKPELQHKLNAFENSDPYQVLESLGIEIMKDEYQIKDTIFWNDVQDFHDYDRYWTKSAETGNKLTKLGESAYFYLIEKYS